MLDFILFEAVAKRGGYATLSELMRDALIHGLCRRTAAAYGTQPLILALKGGTYVFSCRVILIYLCRVIKKKQQL